MNFQIELGQVIAAIIGAIFGSGTTWLVMKTKINGSDNNVVNQSGATSQGDMIGRDKK